MARKGEILIDVDIEYSGVLEKLIATSLHKCLSQRCKYIKNEEYNCTLKEISIVDGCCNNFKLKENVNEHTK